MSRPVPSPRVLQLYSPRRPSPLGLPPLAPHMAFQDAVCSPFPNTPERHYIQQSEATATATATGPMRFPPEARRPLAGATQRCRAPPPAPLNLDTQHHPGTVQFLSAGTGGGVRSDHGQTQQQQQRRLQQPQATEEMRVPPSPTPSSTSSLSLYSSESAKKVSPIGVGQEEEEAEEGRKGAFCTCFNFSALFGIKSKSNKKVLAPRESTVSTEPASAPQMVQTRRRPPPIMVPPITR